MVNQFFTVVGWQPHAEEWRVWQIERQGSPTRKRQATASTKRQTVIRAREQLGAAEFGALVRNKDGSPAHFVAQSNALWQMAKKTTKFFGEHMYVIRQSPNGDWIVWTAGPTKGYRRHVTGHETKIVAKKRAENLWQDDIVGTLLLDSDHQAHSFQANLPVWNRIATGWLRRDAAASMIR